MAGCAEREDRCLDGFGAAQAIVAADLEETHVALAAIEIPLESGGHGDDASGLEDIGFLGERIGEARGLCVWRTKERVAIFGDVGNGDDFAIAEADQTLAEARFGFVVRETRGSDAGGGQARGKFVEAINAGDFFDEIDFAFHFGAPRGLGAFPRGQERTFGAAILIDADGCEAEGAQAGLNLLVGNVGSRRVRVIFFGARLPG